MCGCEWERETEYLLTPRALVIARSRPGWLPRKSSCTHERRAAYKHAGDYVPAERMSWSRPSREGGAGGRREPLQKWLLWDIWLHVRRLIKVQITPPNHGLNNEEKRNGA